MIRKCKSVDITDRLLIQKSVYSCLDSKYNRNDSLRMLAEYGNTSKSHIKRVLQKEGKPALEPIVEKIVDELRSEIINRNLELIPIWYKDKADPSSGKIRHIGIQNIKQQMFDYIAVNAMKEALVAIGEYQCASMPGRGPIYGVQAIEKWLRNKKCKYCGQLDVRHCFESIDHDKVMEFLAKHIKNDGILWLVKTLLSTFEKGLSIGSYLSQYLCNYYLSQIYHMSLTKIRHSKRDGDILVQLTKHRLLYMDDIILLGTSAKDIHKAVDLVTEQAHKMGLEIKSSWKVFKAKYGKGTGEYIDVMGFNIYRDHITIRKKDFIRIRRSYLRAWSYIRQNRPIPLEVARRCTSYYGTLNNTDSKKFIEDYHVEMIVTICKKEISEDAKNYNRLHPERCQLLPGDEQQNNSSGVLQSKGNNKCSGRVWGVVYTV